ncbi:metabolite traffic protein EboE [uncultured Roseobacter sp.]|uniref:metabolite traffic protein EboE n=1 Tax=uncultured Roseobacter sp. TaxID=114847 RepID=UPI002615FC04|nr:metabolite traffic protein EboE [uncultured Roseobacter sp.]
MLTYCMNIHPTQTYAETIQSLQGPVRKVKAGFSPKIDFPIGLRFSAETARAVLAGGKTAELADVLSDIGLLPLTMNGFPYGPFHGTRVKENVYLPDWRASERVDYTHDLITLMADINRPETFLTISTVPGAFRPNGVGAEAAMTAKYIASVADCIRIGREKGQTIALAIEPEPFCFLETIEETIAFFKDYLFSREAAQTLAEKTGLALSQAEQALHDQIGLCYDVCHAAVEFEDPAQNFKDLAAEGIEVHKIQLSSALRVAKGSPAMREALAPFNEPTYLHQLISKGENGLRRFSDLPEALGPDGAADGEEWRVHFHVPLFVETLAKFDSTQAFLKQVLALHRKTPLSRHLEIETYTWDVLPDGIRAETIEQDILRELKWVSKQLAAV